MVTHLSHLRSHQMRSSSRALMTRPLFQLLHSTRPAPVAAAALLSLVAVLNQQQGCRRHIQMQSLSHFRWRLLSLLPQHPEAMSSKHHLQAPSSSKAAAVTQPGQRGQPGGRVVTPHRLPTPPHHQHLGGLRLSQATSLVHHHHQGVVVVVSQGAHHVPDLPGMTS
jgi:hypothetical protein